MAKKTVSIIFGTRPEAIKLCPIVLALRDHPRLEAHVCVTAQHRQMLDQVLDVFGVTPDADLNLMQPGQTLGQFTSRAIAALDTYLAERNPGLALAQGDTTTVLSAALAAFYHHIPLGHVEAGRVSEKVAMDYASSPHDFKLMLASSGRRASDISQLGGDESPEPVRSAPEPAALVPDQPGQAPGPPQPQQPVSAPPPR